MIVTLWGKKKNPHTPLHLSSILALSSPALFGMHGEMVEFASLSHHFLKFMSELEENPPPLFSRKLVFLESDRDSSTSSFLSCLNATP